MTAAGAPSIPVHGQLVSIMGCACRSRCRCGNCGHVLRTTVTSARQTKWNIVIFFSNTSARNMLYGGTYVRTYAKVCHVEIKIGNGCAW